LEVSRVLGKGVEKVVEFIEKCLKVGGVPMVVTRYAGRRLTGPDGSPAVIVRCWGKRDVLEGGTIYGIPEEFIEKAERYVGDYKWILAEYGHLTS